MAQYTVEIKETLAAHITVEANNESEAQRIVISDYRNGDIILDADNYIDTDFEVQAA